MRFKTVANSMRSENYADAKVSFSGVPKNFFCEVIETKLVGISFETHFCHFSTEKTRKNSMCLNQVFLGRLRYDSLANFLKD
jgi:hypothetical protein